MQIRQNVCRLLEELKNGNCYGEEVLLVAATKTRTPQEIQCAIDAGIKAVAENKVQEFREKHDLIHGADQHFIGRLQTNKVKYLMGKVDLIHSVDRDPLAEEIDRRAAALRLTQDVLIEVNIASEASKGGYPLEEAMSALRRIRTDCVRPVGFMAMLPRSDDDAYLETLAKKMRNLFEKARDADENIRWLSMGMSGDWKLCLRHGANMIRLGTAIFGERNDNIQP